MENTLLKLVQEAGNPLSRPPASVGTKEHRQTERPPDTHLTHPTQPPPVKRQDLLKERVSGVKQSVSEKLRLSEKLGFLQKQKLVELSPPPSLPAAAAKATSPLLRPAVKLKSGGSKSDSDSGYGDVGSGGPENRIKQVGLQRRRFKRLDSSLRILGSSLSLSTNLT